MSKKLYPLLFIFFGLLCSCQKSNIPIYQQNAGLFFGTNTYSYTFMEDPDLDVKTIKLPVNISGNAVDYDREFNVAIKEGEKFTTAASDQYTIKKCVVPANEFSGYVEFEIQYDKRLNDSIYRTSLAITDSKDFPNLELNKNYITVSFTRMVLKPANWKWLSYYFGTYSTSWWKFIQEKTGRTSLPYFPSDPDTITWWMSLDQVKAYQALVRFELGKFNNSPEGPLLHDDGELANQEVQML